MKYRINRLNLYIKEPTLNLAMQRFLLFVFTAFYSSLFAQVYNPAYKNLIQIVNDSNVTFTDYQVRFVLNTATLVSDGKLNLDGSDLRFSPNSCAPSIFYPYWIQDYFNSDSTIVWVKIPQIDPLTTHEIFMWYGDTSASPVSDFNSTFPVSFISNGVDTSLSGVVTYDWFQLDTGDVINLESEQALQIRSRVIIINGQINGNGMGYLAPSVLGVGGGPGGGGSSNNAGAGGGSNGGIGGTGGFDMGDSPGTGGPINGSVNQMDFNLGSSGGSTDNAMGGHGGGALWLDAEFISLNGEILLNGLDGVGSIGRCGGGGAGGTLLITAADLNLGAQANMHLTGGNGGDGASAANDGGGGGAGGRIKLFHQGLPIQIDSVSVIGGEGGLQGSMAFGLSGEFGTTFDSIVSFPYPHCILGNEFILTPVILNLDSVYCLIKDSILLEAEPPGGTFAGPGVMGGYFFPLTAGVGVHTITYIYDDPFGCGVSLVSATTEVLNIPSFPVATNNGPLCENETLQLNVTDSSYTYHWIGPNGFESPVQSPTLMNVSSADSGTYTVVITNPSGCTSSASTYLVVHNNPDATVSNNSPLCIAAELQLEASGGMMYSWTGPNGFSSAVPNPGILQLTPLDEGIYTVTITGNGGCTTVAITDVIVDDCYDDVNEHPVSRISLFPNPATREVILEFDEELNLNGLQLIISDVQGKEILPRLIYYSPLRMILDVSGLANGLYYLRLSTTTLVREFKFLKQ